MQQTKDGIVLLIFNLLLGLAGFIFLNNPDLAIRFIRYYLGIILIVISFIPFAMYKYKTFNDKSDLYKGIILVGVGLFFILSEQGSTLVFGIALVIWMASSSLLRFIKAFQYRQYFKQTWWLMLIFAIITLGFTVYIVFNVSETLNILIGIAALFMIIEASLGIIGVLLFPKQKVIE